MNPFILVGLQPYDILWWLLNPLLLLMPKSWLKKARVLYRLLRIATWLPPNLLEALQNSLS